MRFTDKAIMNLKPGTGIIMEDNGHGFGIRVSPRGRKTWIYRYRFEGEQQWMSFGHYPKVTLAEAHAAHGIAKEELDRGINPGAKAKTEKDQERMAPTIGILVNEYLEKWARPRKRSWREDERMLNKDVLPIWGHKKAKDITRRDVRLLLERIADRGAPIQSNRVFACVRRMFAFAVERDMIEQSPCTHVKPVAKENRKDRVLNEEEIKAFWDGLEHSSMSESIRRALKLILITAQRPSEVLGASWSEIDGDWWTIPAERSKNQLAHRVYLTPLTKELLGATGEGYVFPSPVSNDKPIDVNALGHALRRNIGDWEVESFTSHDLRRTAASFMTANGILRLTVSKILNHAEPGVTAVYDRHSYDQDKKKALLVWERKLKTILGESKWGKVIPLR